MSIKEKVDNYIKDIAKNTAHAVYDEMQPQQECYDGFSLPEIDRNKMLAMSIQKTHKDIKAAVPAGVAMDACCDTSKFSSFYNITNPVDDIIYTHFATQGFIGFQACALLCQNWLINKACTLPPKDAIRPDYDLSYATEADAENLDKDFLAKITNISNDPKGYNIKKVCKLFAEKKRQYGQVLAYPIVEGADYLNPFNIDGITPDSYKGMTVIDPIWYVGELDEEAINDPTSLRYFKPTYFRMPNGIKIHHSWCIFGITSEVPDVLKPTYFWGGYPIPQLIYKRVYAAEKTANEAPMLAMSKRLLVADINVQGYLANPQKTDEQLKAISMFRDNYGVMTKRPGDSVQQIDTSLTDLDEVIMTQYQLVAAAANIPATKLLETQPKGFNSTGEYEDDQYKLLLTSIQEDDYVPLLNFHYALLSKSKYGIVRDYTINFSEIDTPTEKERAEINSMEAQTAAVLVNAGVISPDEVRNKLIKNPDSGFNDIEDDLPEDDEPFNFGEEEQEGNGETPQDPFSMDEDWKESDHPRKENGEFTNGSNSSSSKNKPSERHNRVRNRQRKPLNMSNTEKAVLRDAVARNQFNDEEKESGYATRYTSQYSYLVKIDNADLLSYTPISRSKIQ
jgi:phage-related protein (TIGR01555 family)